jgi:hypothetical protein
MTLRFQAETKELAHALGTILRTAPIYKGFPNHSYMIGDIRAEEGGVVVFPASADTEAVRRVTEGLAAMGFALAAPLAKAPTAPAQADALTIEIPIAGFTETAIANLEKLVASNAVVLRLALGTEALPIERTAETLRFPWFTLPTGGASEAVAAYTLLVHKMCEMAKRQKRVLEKPAPADNPKWQMRTFLLRLGFVGPEYKTARKILTAGLSGDGAYPDGDRPGKAKVTQS